MLEQFAPKNQEVPIFIGATIREFGYDVTFLSQAQALQFVNDKDEYTKKACVSLSAIFKPFAPYDSRDNGDFVFPSGLANYHESIAVDKSITLTKGDEINYDDLNIGNTYGPNGGEMRLMGLAKNVYFVDTHDTLNKDNGNGYAGPLDLKWNHSQKKWQANVDIPQTSLHAGYISSNSISAPNGLGQYTTFMVNANEVRNYDNDLSLTSAKNLFCVSIFVSGVIPTNSSAGGIPGTNITPMDRTVIGDDDDNCYWLPLYIGCR